MQEGVPSRPRVLVVAQDFPWPAMTGSQIRLGTVIAALGKIGDVDLFCFVHSQRADPCDLPVGAPVLRAATATYASRPLTPGRRVRWILSRQPLLTVTTDYREPRREFAAWAMPPYDLVWFSRAHTFEALGRPQLGPTIVDLDDLEDQKIRARRDVWREHTPHRSGLRARGAFLQASLDAARWRRIQKSVASSVATVTVCSELDARRLGARNISIVPNGYPVPAEPAGGSSGGEQPTILFAGFQLYEPNIDGAKWLVGEVLPHLQQLVPGVRLRLVGESVPAVDRLHDLPAVTVVGRVPEMFPELCRASLVAVPIRFGSGTRVKILEAFAHRIPVVATTLGAEGLQAESGRHLLLADTPQAFAQACAQLLQDDRLRSRVVDEAERLYRAHHTRSQAEDVVAGLALRHLLSSGVVR